MKKICLQCTKEFSGRTDKLFCSLECKNSFHNARRRQDYIHVVDTALHQNRVILQRIWPTLQKEKNIDRKVLEKLGFRFDLVTGYSTMPNGKVLHRVYDFEWSQTSKSKIAIQQDTIPVVADLTKKT